MRETHDEDDDLDQSDSSDPSRGNLRVSKPQQIKLWGALVLVVVMVGAILGTGDSLSLERIADREAGLRHWVQSQPVLTYAAAFLLYVFVTGASLPGAAPLTLVYGWFFGFWPALVLVSFASTLGATIAFLASRYFFSDLVRARWGRSLQRFNDSFDREGTYYLLTLRLIPQVPFFLINLVMGLTPIRVGTFYWVSQLGMLPGTAVFVYAGSTVPTLQTLVQEGVRSVISWQLIVALTLLGLLPLSLRYLVKRFSRRNVVVD